MRRRKTRKPTQTAEQLADEIRIELRSIIRQWNNLHKPLNCSKEVTVQDNLYYRIDRAQSYEELEELTLRFAGSVWHLKDRLKCYVDIKKLDLRKTLPNGAQVCTSIEEELKNSLNLLLCADLYNSKKHGALDNPRTPYTPILNGVSFDTSASHVVGFQYNGASKIGDVVARNPYPVPWQIEIISNDAKYSFGNAIVVITRAFGHWIPLIRQLGIIGDDPESTWIADNLCVMEDYIQTTSPFGPSTAKTPRTPTD